MLLLTPPIQNDQMSSLYAESQEMGVVIFKEPGLTILAAPWRFALTAKLDRIAKQKSKPYDMDDAITYLQQIVMTSGKVERSAFTQWADEFQELAPDDALLDKLQDGHISRYGTEGLI
jgi:hypothetical protein